MAIHYTQKVMEYFKNPKNVGVIENPDAEATEGSPACGDMITMQLKVDSKTQKITDIKFKSYGCASNIATASIITELAKGKTLEYAKKLNWDSAAKELGGLPPVKMHCSVLAVNTLLLAIKDYEIKHGLLKEEKKDLTQQAVIDELQHVMNPEIGVNIFRLKMVKEISLGDGNVKITISMGNTDAMYADNIAEEVEEHISALKSVKSVEVKIID